MSAISSMTPPQLRPQTSASSKDNKTWRESFRSTRKDILHIIGYNAASTPATEIPPDNIFVPIQQDDILPQIPIGRHHPVPLKGIEDDELRTLHTNSFYANSFLGEQNQPIWTHPYSIWWGKGWEGPGLVETWGMCVSHIEESDLVFGEGNPPPVSFDTSRDDMRLTGRTISTRSASSAWSSLRGSSPVGHFSPQTPISLSRSTLTSTPRRTPTSRK
jgi:endo-1,3(4)-beta-glucanase